MKAKVRAVHPVMAGAIWRSVRLLAPGCVATWHVYNILVCRSCQARSVGRGIVAVVVPVFTPFGRGSRDCFRG